jgi:hypothetical protein
MNGPDNAQTDSLDRENKTYLPIKTEFLRPWGSGRFSIYIRKGQGLVLYAARGGAYTKDQAQKLKTMGIEQVYLHKGGTLRPRPWPRASWRKNFPNP